MIEHYGEAGNEIFFLHREEKSAEKEESFPDLAKRVCEL